MTGIIGRHLAELNIELPQAPLPVANYVPAVVAGDQSNFTSYQMRSSFGAHETQPGRLTLNDAVSVWVRAELRRMDYQLDFAERTSGPINAIYLDRAHNTLWGGSSNHGEDDGVAW